jgi:hypothetical protein
MNPRNYRALLALLAVTACQNPSEVRPDDGANARAFKLVSRGCEAAETQPTSHSGLSLKASVDRSSYRIGESLTLSVKPDQTAYISVIDHGSVAGQEAGVVLFVDKPITGGATLVFPPEGKMMEVQGPAGSNVLQIVASRREGVVNQGANGKGVVVKASESTPHDDTVNCNIRFVITD